MKQVMFDMKSIIYFWIGAIAALELRFNALSEAKDWEYFSDLTHKDLSGVVIAMAVGGFIALKAKLSDNPLDKTQVQHQRQVNKMLLKDLSELKSEVLKK